jgi:hypothetical protein
MSNCGDGRPHVLEMHDDSSCIDVESSRTERVDVAANDVADAVVVVEAADDEAASAIFASRVGNIIRGVDSCDDFGLRPFTAAASTAAGGEMIFGTTWQGLGWAGSGGLDG